MKTMLAMGYSCFVASLLSFTALIIIIQAGKFSYIWPSGVGVIGFTIIGMVAFRVSHLMRKALKKKNEEENG